PERAQGRREAEKDRRARVRTEPTGQPGPRGHAAPPPQVTEPNPTPGTPSCDRPGCYEPAVSFSFFRRSYCGADCRDAVRFVEDRERKWLERGRAMGCPGCATEIRRRARMRERHRGTAERV